MYVTRAWCLFELFTAVSNSQDVEVNIVLSPTQSAPFAAAMARGNYAALEAVLDGVHAESATATQLADLRAIQGYVSQLPGGITTLNETVRGHLRRWFEGQGAVLTSSRVQAQRRSSQLRSASRPPADTPLVAPLELSDGVALSKSHISRCTLTSAQQYEDGDGDDVPLMFESSL